MTTTGKRLNIWEEIDQARIEHWVDLLKDIKPGDGSPGYFEQTGDGMNYLLEIDRSGGDEWSISACEMSSGQFDYFLLYMAEPFRSGWRGHWHGDAHDMVDHLIENDELASEYTDIIGRTIERDFATAMDRLAESKTDMEGLSFDVRVADGFGPYDIDVGGSADGDSTLEEVARLIIKVEDALSSVVDDYGPGVYAASWDALDADRQDRLTELVRKYQEANQPNERAGR